MSEEVVRRYCRRTGAFQSLEGIQVLSESLDNVRTQLNDLFQSLEGIQVLSEAVKRDRNPTLRQVSVPRRDSGFERVDSRLISLKALRFVSVPRRDSGFERAQTLPRQYSLHLRFSP